MSSSLTADLREGYIRVACSLSEEHLALLARKRDTINVRLAERNRILAEIVANYRTGPRELWGPILLDLAAPALLEVLQRFHASWPVIEEQDVSQQLVLQFLHAAATTRVPKNGWGLRRRLVSRAAKAVARRLIRERRYLNWHCSLEALEEKNR
jgi:hypothetical protein